jgi:hypothetical protein
VEPVNVSLLEFLRTGQLGPVRLGMDREALRAALGEPELTGGTSRKYPRPSIWKYGSMEFFFPPQGEGLWMIFTDDFPLAGGAGLHLEPGWLRGGLSLAEARAHLDAAGLPYTLGEPAFDAVKLTLGSGVVLHFSLEPESEGLAAISRS